jgi:A/G-specific adenine glycosylase
LDAVRGEPRNPRINRRLWQRAEEILPARNIGDFNSALMELGATVCTPRNPNCPQCPLRTLCRAFTLSLHERIPPRRKSRPTPLEKRWTFAVASRGRWLIEKRPPSGRWANMWQFVTVQANGKPSDVAAALGFPVTDMRNLGEIRHTLTHRRYQFSVFACRAAARKPGNWVTLKELSQYPLPRPHVLIARMLSAGVESAA